MLSRINGKMNAATQAIPMAHLYYRNLQACLREALQEAQDYSSTATLTEEAREELQWWIDHFMQWNRRSLICHDSSISIETDASTKGGGGSVQQSPHRGPIEPSGAYNAHQLPGTPGSTLGNQMLCQKQDKPHHHNEDGQHVSPDVHQRGGTISPRLNQSAKDLRLWCMGRNILLKVQHLPGVYNTTADNGLRVMKDRSDWKLFPAVFHQINWRLGRLEVDLFASGLTQQLPNYASWRPDPTAMATDSFTMNWAQMRGYAKPHGTL